MRLRAHPVFRRSADLPGRARLRPARRLGPKAGGATSAADDSDRRKSATSPPVARWPGLRSSSHQRMTARCRRYSRRASASARRPRGRVGRAEHRRAEGALHARPRERGRAGEEPFLAVADHRRSEGAEGLPVRPQHAQAGRQREREPVAPLPARDRGCLARVGVGQLVVERQHDRPLAREVAVQQRGTDARPLGHLAQGGPVVAALRDQGVATSYSRRRVASPRPVRPGGRPRLRFSLNMFTIIQHGRA